MKKMDLRDKITALFKRIESGKYKCKCGGKLVAEVRDNGCCTAAFSEEVWLPCSREWCNRSSRWYYGGELLEAFEDWKESQK